jgi:molybdate transport system ATP-binding protein
MFATFPPSAVTLFRDQPEGSSRNRWPVSVGGLELHGDTVRVDCEGSVPLMADVTQVAVAELGLQVGDQVWAAVKATEIRAYPG